MLGGLSLHQPQPFITPPNNQTQISEHRLTDKPSVPSLPQVKSIKEFKQLHAQSIKVGLDRIPRYAGDLLSACALSKWGSLDYAQSIFSNLDNPGTFDFNIMIRAYVNNYSLPNSALLLYQEMVERDIQSDNYTFPFVLKACAHLSVIREGMQVHGHALKLGFDSDIFVQNSLINLYGKCQDIKLSCRVFDQMDSNRTVASWSALLAAHTRMGLWADCLNRFAEMMGQGIRPEESSLVSALSACAYLGALDLGRSIHCSLCRNFTGLNVIVQTTLVDMYAKCGSLEKGLAIFNRMSDKNIYTYSVAISGLAMHGEGEKALETFNSMLKDGLDPDEAIYVGVLSACSHAGLVEEGLRFFDQMQVEHRIKPTAQHYGCMVDLMGQAGQLDEAYAMIQSIPIRLPTDIAWRSLLSACKVHDNLEIAEYAIRNLVQLNGIKAGDYVILSNMYATAGRWDDAAIARTQIADRGLLQVPGYSQVEVKGKMYTFVSQDKSHSWSDQVYEMLYQMEWQLRFEGYKPDLSEVLLFDVEEEEKRRVLSGHSQKLAIAFALLTSSEGDAIRIVTNLRMCNECHTYTRLISKIFDRKIVVRDRNRFHCFRQGACSCGDHW